MASNGAGRPAGRNASGEAATAAQTRPGGGFIHRTIRALSLDPDLYREVSSSGGGTGHAALVVLLAAAGAGLGESGRVLLEMLKYPAIDRRTGLLWAAFVDESLPIGALNAVAHLAAWPCWAAALWFIGRRLASDGWTPRFGPVARGLAFAQAPGVLLILTPLFVRALVPIIGVASDWGTDFDRWDLLAHQLPASLDIGLRAVISGWILIGTFLAMRESLGLSNGLALAALLSAGVAIAIFMGACAAAVALVVPSPPWTFDHALPSGTFLGIGGTGPLVTPSIQEALPITLGFDFNLGLIEGFMRIFARAFP